MFSLCCVLMNDADSNIVTEIKFKKKMKMKMWQGKLFC